MKDEIFRIQHICVIILLILVSDIWGITWDTVIKFLLTWDVIIIRFLLLTSSLICGDYFRDFTRKNATSSAHFHRWCTSRVCHNTYFQIKLLFLAKTLEFNEIMISLRRRSWFFYHFQNNKNLIHYPIKSKYQNSKWTFFL